MVVESEVGSGLDNLHKKYAATISPVYAASLVAASPPPHHRRIPGWCTILRSTIPDMEGSNRGIEGYTEEARVDA